MVTINKITIISTFLLIASYLCAQSDTSTLESGLNDTIMVGKCKRIELQNGEFGKYFFESYRNYEPNQELLELIKNKIFNCTITIIIGTWCHDSHQQVPGFIKILDKIDYNTNYLNIICVDKQKQAADTDITSLNIEKVPTFIFYKNNKEVGRIIETPANSLEIDTYNIINE